MLSETPKQFLLLSGRPLLMHTIDVFSQYNPAFQLVLVLPEKNIPYWQSLCAAYSFSVPCKLVAGGETRFESVLAGLKQIDQEGLVAIHDGVRPLLTPNLISRLLSVAEEKGNAIPVMPVVESIRKIEGSKNKPVPRNQYVIVQTPQVFRVKEIQKAYLQTKHKDFTDDATVLESVGISINLVEGERNNLKITTPVDFLLAESILTGIE